MLDEALTKGERTRLSIMEAAYALFLERGFHATSMRQIAERSGLALGGIYNHFPSKEDVFQAIMVERHPYFQILPVLLAAPGETVEEFVRNAAQALISELGQRPDFIKLMFVEIVEFDGQHMPMLFEKMFPEILPLIQRFQVPEGELRPFPTPILLRAFLGLFFSYYMTEFLIGHVMIPELQENALDHFVDIFLHGILAGDS